MNVMNRTYQIKLTGSKMKSIHDITKKVMRNKTMLFAHELFTLLILWYRAWYSTVTCYSSNNDYLKYKQKFSIIYRRVSSLYYDKER